jgi:hypothetical protein
MRPFWLISSCFSRLLFELGMFLLNVSEFKLFIVVRFVLFYVFEFENIYWFLRCFFCWISFIYVNSFLWIISPAILRLYGSWFDCIYFILMFLFIFSASCDDSFSEFLLFLKFPKSLKKLYFNYYTYHDTISLNLMANFVNIYWNFNWIWLSN